MARYTVKPEQITFSPRGSRASPTGRLTHLRCLRARQAGDEAVLHGKGITRLSRPYVIIGIAGLLHPHNVFVSDGQLLDANVIAV